MNIIKRINCFILILFFLSLQILFAQDATIYLWKDVKGMKNEPSVMFMHKVKNSDGFNQKTPCVIICPGGSYHHLGLYNEGFCSAKWFSKNGITYLKLK